MKWSVYNELIENSENTDIFTVFNTLREKYFTLDIALKDIILVGMNDVSSIEDIHPELYNP